MIVEYTRYKIEEGQRLGFEDNYRKALVALELSAYELSRCEEDPSYYVRRIEWDSKDGHLQGFRSSPKFREFFASIQPYVRNIEKMRHCLVVSNKSASGNYIDRFPLLSGGGGGHGPHSFLARTKPINRMSKTGLVSLSWACIGSRTTTCYISSNKWTARSCASTCSCFYAFCLFPFRPHCWAWYSETHL